MNWTDKIRSSSARIGQIFKEQPNGTTSSTSPHIYKRSAFEEYRFDGSQILLNEMPLQRLLEGDKVEIQLWAGLASALEEFRRKVYADNAETPDFNAQVQVLLDVIMGKMTHAYEEVTGGVRVARTEGRFWVNNIDPRAVLTLFLSNPTEKRRQYLEGVLAKLVLILEGKVGRSHAHGIMAQVRALHQDIQDALYNSQSSHPLLLSAGLSSSAG